MLNIQCDSNYADDSTLDDIFFPSPCFSLQQTSIILTKRGKNYMFFFEVLTCLPMDYSVERSLLCTEDQLYRWNFPEELTVFCLTQ